MSGTKYLLCTKKTIHPTYINTLEEHLEKGNSFKYLETMVNTDSCIEEEVKETIAVGNMAYHVHKTIFIKINIPKLQTTTL